METLTWMRIQAGMFILKCPRTECPLFPVFTYKLYGKGRKTEAISSRDILERTFLPVFTLTERYAFSCWISTVLSPSPALRAMHSGERSDVNANSNWRSRKLEFWVSSILFESTPRSRCSNYIRIRIRHLMDSGTDAQATGFECKIALEKRSFYSTNWFGYC